MSLYNDASLLLIPSGYKAGTVFSQKPTDGDGDLTFTRNSTATRVNSDGLIESVAANVPRLDYSQGSCPAMLLEPQRTNLLLYSQDFSNAQWTKGVGVSVSADSETSPFGVQDADAVTFATGGAIDFLRQSIAFVSGLTYTISVYAKSKSGSTSMGFDIDNSISQNFTITNNWARYTWTVTPAVAYTWIDIQMVGAAEVVFWGAQLEAGAYATSYIPTTSATATRLADTFTRNNIYTNGLISASGGTWFVELKNNVAYVRGSTLSFGIGDLSTLNTNSIFIRYESATAVRLSVSKRIAGSASFMYLTTSDSVKLAIKWNGTAIDIFANGVKVVTASPFTTTLMEFLTNASTSGIGAPIFIQTMALFPMPLSDSDCIALTT